MAGGKADNSGLLDIEKKPLFYILSYLFKHEQFVAVIAALSPNGEQYGATFRSICRNCIARVLAAAQIGRFKRRLAPIILPIMERVLVDAASTPVSEFMALQWQLKHMVEQEGFTWEKNVKLQGQVEQRCAEVIPIIVKSQQQSMNMKHVTASKTLACSPQVLGVDKRNRGRSVVVQGMGRCKEDVQEFCAKISDAFMVAAQHCTDKQPYTAEQVAAATAVDILGEGAALEELHDGAQL